ncbi:MAG: hypothetical protein LUE24_09845 [Lachnospiraceae bacterium]|nr:hypothetical protein [Lachnospiraceae bacterium]
MVSAAGTSDGQTGYGVFDLFTGRQLLDYKYSSIQYVSGYIYALDNAQNTWTIYKVNLSL